jgi:CspA family cold shock protein
MSSDSQIVTNVLCEGRVKWFNNKTGYGFITVIGGDMEGTDIFAHHSEIKVSNDQYRYLVEGEYIEFKVTTDNTGKHKFNASEISGVKGGKLLCETRNEARKSMPRRVKKAVVTNDNETQSQLA